ncbi:MAG: hypothetical protein JRN20_04005 [Nitrososphaerota archaeon]|nr:hypothetical protein [Nitrososphaerota archaeon]
MNENKILSETTSVQAAPSSPVQPLIELTKSEKFLKSLFAKATERGYTPTQLVNQCIKIDQLEKKYARTFDELKSEYERLAKEISSRSKRVQELEDTIAETKKKKKEVAREYSADEKNVRQYVDARMELSSIGFSVDDIPRVKTCLFSMKNENFSPEAIIEKLNSIAVLEARKTSLESELSIANGDLREKKALLIQLRQLQQTGLSVEQIERIREVVSRISSRRGINPDQAMSRFESDVLNNYDLTLGLESEVMRLQETKNSLASEFDGRKAALETKEKMVLEKISELESKYQSQKQEIQAYSELRAAGVDGARIQSWNQLISDNRLDFGIVESELRKQGDLRTLEEEISIRIAYLQEKEKVLTATISELNTQKSTLESTISSIKEHTLSAFEESRTAMLSSVSQVKEEVKQVSDLAKTDLKAALSELSSEATTFQSNMTNILQKAGEETKKHSELLETAERIGRYEAVLPVLKLSEDGDVSETEALVAMWNVSNTFAQWLRKQKITPTRIDILELLGKTTASLNQEIQTVGA